MKNISGIWGGGGGHFSFLEQGAKAFPGRTSELRGTRSFAVGVTK